MRDVLRPWSNEPAPGWTCFREFGAKIARESGFDRKNFIRKLVRGIPVKRNSYEEFVRWLQSYESENLISLC